MWLAVHDGAVTSGVIIALGNDKAYLSQRQGAAA